MPSWDKLQATRALTLLSLISGAVALVAGFVSRAAGRGRALNLATACSAFAFVTDMIGMSVFASLPVRTMRSCQGVGTADRGPLCWFRCASRVAGELRLQ